MKENNSSNLSDSDFNLREQLSIYLKNWKWFLLSLILFLALAKLVIKYSTPKYKAQSKIQIIEDSNAATGFDLFSEVDILSGGQNKVEDEIEIIASRSNFIEVVKSLGLNTRIVAMGNFRDSELYDRSPIRVNIIAPDSIIQRANYSFFIDLTSTTNFDFIENEGEEGKKIVYGEKITTPIGGIVITPVQNRIRNYIGKKLAVKVKPVPLVAERYRANLSVQVPQEYSNILNISLEDPVKQKAADVINNLIEVYNRNAVEDKQEIADKTSNFINERIADISANLTNVDQTAESFKTERGVTDISSEANINLNVGATNRSALANVQTELQMAESMRQMVDDQDGYEVLPSNLGLSDPTIAASTKTYNQLVQERNRLLESADEKNPMIVNLDQQLNSIKKSMQASLGSSVNNLGLQVNTLSRQQAIINSKIYSAPKNERALRDITRQQQTTESLYLYLLQKREEAQIGVAATAPKSKLIDRAYINPVPVSPKTKIIYLALGLIGLLIPFSIIYAKDFFDNKVHSMHHLEKVVPDLPILGELPRISKKDKKIVTKNDRSVLAEALRIIRTNLDYLIKTTNLQHSGTKNIIFVTSSLPGEGKTFLSANLSMILATTQKKVLLIGGDIRNPKFVNFFVGQNIDRLSANKNDPDKGLTEFLIDETLSIRDITNSMLVHENSFDVIFSGKIPPNPAELLLSSRFEELFDEASRKYDYVIVDTAPMLPVSDTLLISQYANQIIYVTRAGTTELNTLDYPLRLLEEGKIKGLSFVVNDVKLSELGYGGKYGYGYGRPQKKWWQF